MICLFWLLITGLLLASSLLVLAKPISEFAKLNREIEKIKGREIKENEEYSSHLIFFFQEFAQENEAYIPSDEIRVLNNLIDSYNAISEVRNPRKRTLEVLDFMIEFSEVAEKTFKPVIEGLPGKEQNRFFDLYNQILSTKQRLKKGIKKADEVITEHNNFLESNVFFSGFNFVLRNEKKKLFQEEVENL